MAINCKEYSSNPNDCSDDSSHIAGNEDDLAVLNIIKINKLDPQLLLLHPGILSIFNIDGIILTQRIETFSLNALLLVKTSAHFSAIKLMLAASILKSVSVTLQTSSISSVNVLTIEATMMGI